MPDYERAFLWFSKAAIKDNPEVKYYLALCLEQSLALHKYKGNTYMKDDNLSADNLFYLITATYEKGFKRGRISTY